MVRKRLDDRVRKLLERGVATNERSMLVLVGDYGKDQVPNLHAIMTKSSPDCKRPKVLWCYKKELGFSSHKKKRMKKLKRDRQRGLDGSLSEQADNFELFVSQTDITWCYYKDSHRVLGTTNGLLVLQDFEALTPNLMARTIETVQGGGLVVVLLRTVKSLKQLYAMSMDVHSRYRTESSGDVVPRFNERFILSLGSKQCGNNCLVCDDELNVLPISKRALRSLGNNDNDSDTTIEKGDAGQVILRQTKEQIELQELQESLIDTPHIGVLVSLTKTLDQAKAVLVFLEACSEKTASSSRSTTVAMTAARGRGKSAAIGLCLAGALSLGYSTIAVTAPTPENLVSVFEFCLNGLNALKYQEHMDYTVQYSQASGREQTKCVTAIRVHKTHRQSVQYLPPAEKDKFASAEIVAIDEAAAIPLPIVRALSTQTSGSGDRLTFLSSTVNGYEGTGRALSLKLIKELRDAKASRRQADIHAASAAAMGIEVAKKSNKSEAKVHEQRWKAAATAAAAGGSGGGEKLLGPLREIELTTPIRYATNDPVEAWLNKLLCLDCGSASNLKLNGGAPAPADCELYSVDRDALFSFHKLSEAFLQKVMGLYTSAHYKNTPNDLQMLSDAPSHSIFVLLSPSAEQDSDNLPDVLAVVQVALEGKISRKAVEAQLARGHRSAGDLIPWTISQQFSDSKFAQLSGVRIVRIAVHPCVQSMGYGSRALELLYRFYNGELVSLGNDDDDDDDDDGTGEVDKEDEQSDSSGDSDNENDATAEVSGGIRGETLKPRKNLPPLLLPLTEVDAPQLDWIGTSFGLTAELHKFWSRAGGMRMLYLRQTKNELTGEHSAIMLRALPRRTGFDDRWLSSFLQDFRRRYIALLAGAFRDLDLRLAISVLESMFEVPREPTASSAANTKITSDELEYYLTPHDLKRLELYGRNLCDHHLVTDLLPTICRLYFAGRFSSLETQQPFRLTSVQGGLLCGVGLQNRTIDSIVAELGLPANQVLAMFNKSVRKISIALNGIVELKEKQELLDGKKRKEVEKVAERMRDVSRQTLEEDAKEAAIEAMDNLNRSEAASSLPSEISKDNELMNYVVKGTDDQWKKALDMKDIDASAGAAGTVRIQSVRDKQPSKVIDADEIENEAAKQQAEGSNKKRNKKSKKRKSRH